MNQVTNALSLFRTDSLAAEQQLYRIIEEDPLLSDAREALGFLLSRQQKYEKAIQMLKTVAKLDPNNEVVYFNLGYLHQQLGNMTSAILYFEKSVAQHNEQSLTSELLLGQCYHQRAQFDTAISHYQTVLLLRPMHIVARYALATALVDSNQAKEAQVELQHCQDIIRQNPNASRLLVEFHAQYDWPKWQVLDHKAKFAKLIQSRPFRYYPQTFVLPEDRNSAISSIVNDNRLWMKKAVSLFGGQGTELIHSTDQIPNEPGWIIQEYVANPLLVRNRKFNMRLYLVIIPNDLSCSFLWENGVVFLAPDEYSTNPDQFSNLAIHIANPLTSGTPKDHVWTLKRLIQTLEKMNISTQTIRKKLDTLTNELLVLIQENKLLPQPQMAPHATSVKILGLDVMMTDSFELKLLEIERYPGLSAPEDDLASQAIKEELVEMVATIMLNNLEKEIRND